MKCWGKSTHIYLLPESCVLLLTLTTFRECSKYFIFLLITVNNQQATESIMQNVILPVVIRIDSHIIQQFGNTMFHKGKILLFPLYGYACLFRAMNKSFNPFSTNVSLLYPRENIRKPEVFGCFQGCRSGILVENGLNKQNE